MTVVAGYVDNQHLRLSDDHFQTPLSTAALLAGASLTNDAHLRTTDSEQTRIIGILQKVRLSQLCAWTLIWTV